MARYRYLNCSELVAVRWLAGEALRWRRPRRASRARMYTTHPARDLAPLTLAVRRWLSLTTPDPDPVPTSAPAQDPAAASLPTPTPAPAPAPVPVSGFAAAVAARPRIHALREGTRPRPVEPDPGGRRAAARLRARTAAHRTRASRPLPQVSSVSECSAAWLDARAASRILAWNLGRAA
ncbi:hypothetical protein SUDANB121_02448 [Nocardiopsis dassonvillei]|uniref:hypothetical protein n=1 Tax=Nocardiopsis dassonvillei TaxID=2014 RepID=UPI003F54366D